MGMRFENVMNWGNIITLVVLGGGGLLAMGELRSEVRFTQESVVALRQSQAELKADVLQEQRESEARVRALELGFGRIEERLVSIQTDLQRLVNEREK